MDDIEKIEIFGTNDGSEFRSLAEAKRYNVVLGKCDELEGTIPSRPDDMDFSNGIGWVQHEENTKNDLAMHIIAIYNEYFDYNATTLSYSVGRHISDADIKCLNHLVYRWQCIDKKNREFGQPFFVTNFAKVRGGQIN